MKIKVDRFEITDISALLKGDLFVYQNNLFVVIEKNVQFTTVFNLERHKEIQWDNCIPTSVTRVKGGYITQ